jgi:hypothetical protein
MALRLSMGLGACLREEVRLGQQPAELLDDLLAVGQSHEVRRRRVVLHQLAEAVRRSVIDARNVWVPRNASRLLTRAFVLVRARRPPVRRDPRLQQKGPADPLTTCSVHEDRARCDRDLEEATDPNRPQQRRTAQRRPSPGAEPDPISRPENECSRFAPDSHIRPSNVDANMIDPGSLETGINAGQGGTPMRRVPPCQPSGRQDLNLRPLDPQNGGVSVSARQTRSMPFARKAERGRSSTTRMACVVPSWSPTRRPPVGRDPAGTSVSTSRARGVIQHATNSSRSARPGLSCAPVPSNPADVATELSRGPGAADAGRSSLGGQHRVRGPTCPSVLFGPASATPSRRRPADAGRSSPERKAVGERGPTRPTVLPHRLHGYAHRACRTTP